MKDFKEREMEINAKERQKKEVEIEIVRRLAEGYKAARLPHRAIAVLQEAQIFYDFSIEDQMALANDIVEKVERGELSVEALAFAKSIYHAWGCVEQLMTVGDLYLKKSPQTAGKINKEMENLASNAYRAAIEVRKEKERRGAKR